MAIPDFQTIMLPMLQSVADGQTRSMREVTQLLSQHFSLTEDEQHELLPSGQQSSFSNRVAWAKTHLKAAGLVDNSVRGMIKISESGLNLLATKPPEIKSRLLRNYPSYLEFVSKAEPGPSGDPARGPVEVISIDVQTPHEIMASVYQTLTKATIDELLSRLQSCSPPFFEMIVVRLLMAMGYGGVAGHGLTTGRSGDGGIDGVIKQDKLGLDVVCIQAKD
jgi:restriction system protein